MKTPDLKPCPFCGSVAKVFKLDADVNAAYARYIVGCDGNFMCYGNINHLAMIFVTKETAIATWNRRANDADAT